MKEVKITAAENGKIRIILLTGTTISGVYDVPLITPVLARKISNWITNQ